MSGCRNGRVHSKADPPEYALRGDHETRENCKPSREIPTDHQHKRTGWPSARRGRLAPQGLRRCGASCGAGGRIPRGLPAAIAGAARIHYGGRRKKGGTRCALPEGSAGQHGCCSGSRSGGKTRTYGPQRRSARGDGRKRFTGKRGHQRRTSPGGALQRGCRMKVLIAEDDPISRVLLSRLLVKSGYEVVATANGSEAWEVLRKEGASRLAVLDWMMPGMDGLAVCQRVRARSAGAYTYILLLTSKDATPDLVEGLESGADDYLTKPLNPEELKARLRAGLRILRLEDQLVAAREEMQVKATHDALTRLWNRSAILDMLQRDIARARREGSSVGVLLCDIDHFKSVNDTHGHAAGDEVL